MPVDNSIVSEQQTANEPTSLLEAELAVKEIGPPELLRDKLGWIDIQCSLQALGIADPRTLWSERLQPGSAAHELKKEIARALARGEAVLEITRRDIGLTPSASATRLLAESR